jgi:hypothetical protein
MPGARHNLVWEGSHRGPMASRSCHLSKIWPGKAMRGCQGDLDVMIYGNLAVLDSPKFHYYDGRHTW